MAAVRRPLSSTPFSSLSRAEASGSFPAAKPSETRLRPPSDTARELRDVARRIRSGDFHGALLAAMHLLDERPVPVLCVSPTYLARADLTTSERLVIALVNGCTPLEELLEASGLGLLDGVDVVGGLLDAGVIALDPDDVREPHTMRE